MTQDNGMDAPSEDYRLYRAFQGVAKLIAAYELRDAYLMCAALRDEYRDRLDPDAIDPFSRKPAPPENTQVSVNLEGVKRRWEASRHPIAIVKGQFDHL